jgi:hypothetical protein
MQPPLSIAPGFVQAQMGHHYNGKEILTPFKRKSSATTLPNFRVE